MDVEFHKEEIRTAGLRIEREKSYIDKTKQSIADYLCPFTVGQKIIDDVGEFVVVHTVTFCSWNNKGYAIKIKKFKKNGELRMYPSDCYNIDKYKSYIEAGAEE